MIVQKITHDEAYEAINVIAKVCEQNDKCDSCPFQMYPSLRCGITTQGVPASWHMSKLNVRLFKREEK